MGALRRTGPGLWIAVSVLVTAVAVCGWAWAGITSVEAGGPYYVPLDDQSVSFVGHAEGDGPKACQFRWYFQGAWQNWSTVPGSGDCAAIDNPQTYSENTPVKLTATLEVKGESGSSDPGDSDVADVYIFDMQITQPTGSVNVYVGSGVSLTAAKYPGSLSGGSFTWSVDSGPGDNDDFSSTSSSSTTFTPPVSGDYVLKVVYQPAAGAPTVTRTTSTISAGYDLTVTADPVCIPVGEESSVTSELAPDVSGTYSWATDENERVSLSPTDEDATTATGELLSGTEEDVPVTLTFEPDGDSPIYSGTNLTVYGVSISGASVLWDGEETTLTAAEAPAGLEGTFSWSVDDGSISLSGEGTTQVAEADAYSGTGKSVVTVEFMAEGADDAAVDTHGITVLDLDLWTLVDEVEEGGPGLYLAEDEEEWRSPVFFVFGNAFDDLEEGTVSISKSENLKLYADWSGEDELSQLTFDLSNSSDRSTFTSDVCNQWAYLVGDTASATAMDSVLSLSYSGLSTSRTDTVACTVIKVEMPSTPISIGVDESCTVTCTASPSPGLLPDEVGPLLEWSIADADGASGDLVTQTETSQSASFTAKTGGTGYVLVEYFVTTQPDWPVASDSTPITVWGVGIHEPCVAVDGETTGFEASGYPGGGTYAWSVLNGYAADGILTDEDEEDGEVLFYGTDAGTGYVKVTYGAKSDTAPLYVLDVSITSTTAVSIRVGDQVEVSADAQPDPAAIGGVLYWYTTDGEAGGSCDPSSSSESEATTLTATGAGQAYLVVDYYYGGQCATDSVPLTVAGVSLPAEFVVVNGEEEEFDAEYEPTTGGSFAWSVLETPNTGAAGNFDTASSVPTTFEATGAGTGVVRLKYVLPTKTYRDTAELIVLDVDLETSSVVMETSQSAVLSASTTPEMESIGGWLDWTIEWDEGCEGEASLAPAYAYDSETTLLSTVSPGMGLVKVEYSYGGKTAFDTAPLTILGLSLTPPAVDIGIGDEIGLAATTYPSSGGTLSWSVFGGVADGSFSSPSVRTPTFTGTEAGTAVLGCTFTYGGVPYSGAVPLTVREVEITTSMPVVACGETIQVSATSVPDAAETGGVIAWSVIEGPGNGTLAPDDSLASVFTATDGGNCVLEVQYSGGATAQSGDADTVSCTVIDVDIDSAPDWIMCGDTTQVEGTAIPSATATGGVLTWALIDEDGDDATQAGMFDPNGSPGADVSIFDASDTDSGYYTLRLSYAVSGVTTMDSHPLYIREIPVDVSVEVKAFEESDTAYATSTAIGVGGYDTVVHKASVWIQVEPYESGDTVEVKLSGAEGYENDLVPAKLVCGAVTLEGNGKQVFTLDANGRVEGTLWSSNVSRTCTVSVLGERAFVAFQWDTPRLLPGDWDYEPYFYYDEWMKTLVSLAQRGLPLTGHTIEYRVTCVEGYEWDDVLGDFFFFSYTPEDGDLDYFSQFADMPGIGDGIVEDSGGSGTYTAYQIVYDRWLDGYFTDYVEFYIYDQHCYKQATSN